MSISSGWVLTAKPANFATLLFRGNARTRSAPSSFELGEHDRTDQDLASRVVAASLPGLQRPAPRLDTLWSGNDQPEVSYWIGRQDWGNGFATRALQQFLTEVEVRPLYARAAIVDPARERLLETRNLLVSTWMPTPSMRDCSRSRKRVDPGERLGVNYGRETLENSGQKVDMDASAFCK
jgi:hypothetical protein